MAINKITIRDANLSLDVDRFVESFTEEVISSLINLFLDYNQLTLYSESRDMIVIYISKIELIRQTILSQSTIKSVS